MWVFWGLLALLCAASYAVMTFSRKARLLWTMPQIPKVPLFGSIPFVVTKGPMGRADKISERVEKYGRLHAFWGFHNPIINVADADVCQAVLSSPKYIEKGNAYKLTKWLFGDGLITSKGSVWREDRKLLSPSFKYQKFDGFLAYFNKHSKVLVEILTKEASTQRNNDALNLHPFLARATMDFIKESAFGQPSSFQYDTQGEFLEAVTMALDAVRMRIVRPWLLIHPVIWNRFGMGKEEQTVLRVFDEVMGDAITKRKEMLATDQNNSASGTKPFIDFLLDYKSSEDITGHIVTIFGAGFETTASAMNYTLFLLANHPHWQAKVHTEIDSIFTDNLIRDVTFGDVAELKVLDMCIKESMRMFPPAPVIFRNSYEEDIPLGNGQCIPAGVDMIFAIRELHRDPKYFPDPDKFDPERFLPEACAARHPYAYIPFSIGPRNCLGMKYAQVQMKCCLAHILRHFKVSTAQRLDEIKVKYGVVLEHDPTIMITLGKR